MKLILPLFTLFLSFISLADNTTIASNINKVLPSDMSVQSIKKSQIDGLYVVDIGDLQPIYASKDGNFFLYGELYTVKNGSLENTTKHEVNLKRKNILGQV